MFGMHNENENETNDHSSINYQKAMNLSNSIATDKSSIYITGNTFMSDMTGFKMVVDQGYSGEKAEHLEYLLNFRV